MASTELPVGIDRSRHHHLVGRGWYVWWRRLMVAGLAVVPVLGLLNVFGQHTTTASYTSPFAALRIDSPSTVRGGLIFTTHITITPRERLGDAQLHLDRGWFDDMTFNGVVPQPSQESAVGRWTEWDFGALPADSSFNVWISWQVNPTNVGRHTQAIQVFDGHARLLSVRRTMTVFP